MGGDVIQPHWTEPFVGIPYGERGRDRASCDCWGLVRLVLAERGIVIPAYDLGHATPEERERVAALIRQEKAREPWLPVQAGEERDYDVVVMPRGRADMHIGIVAKPRTKMMLHVSRALGSSRVESYRDMPRLTFYRHGALA